MSAGNPVMAPALPAAGTARLWERQLGAILVQEVRRTFLTHRSLLIYALALTPPALFGLIATVKRQPFELGDIASAFPTVYYFLLRMVVFFGCAWIFTTLVRAQILDRSLHYYFLVPVRRELVLLGKYATGLLGSMVLFGGTTLLTQVVFYIGHSPRVIASQLLTGSGRGLLFDYLTTTAFACLAYGSLFLLVSLYVRNPFIPAIVIWGLEWLNYLLPPALKKISVLFYLQSLAPFPFETSTFAVIADPVSPVAAMSGLVLWSALLLFVACLRFRRMEISYASE